MQDPHPSPLPPGEGWGEGGNAVLAEKYSKSNHTTLAHTHMKHARYQIPLTPFAKGGTGGFLTGGGSQAMYQSHVD